MLGARPRSAGFLALHNTTMPAASSRSRRKTPCVAVALAATLSLTACAQGNGKSASLAPQLGQKAPDTFNPGEPYVLSSEEQALDCKKMTGRMQLRILQVRDAGTRNGSSDLSKSAQKAAVPVFGGTTRGADPGRDLARDQAWLEAANKQLAAKNCPAFDLEAEMQPRSFRDTPTPVPKKN